jgi:hypothetical protein
MQSGYQLCALLIIINNEWKHNYNQPHQPITYIDKRASSIQDNCHLIGANLSPIIMHKIIQTYKNNFGQVGVHFPMTHEPWNFCKK